MLFPRSILKADQPNDLQNKQGTCNYNEDVSTHLDQGNSSNQKAILDQQEVIASPLSTYLQRSKHSMANNNISTSKYPYPLLSDNKEGKLNRVWIRFIQFQL